MTSEKVFLNGLDSSHGFLDFFLLSVHRIDGDLRPYKKKTVKGERTFVISEEGLESEE